MYHIINRDFEYNNEAVIYYQTTLYKDNRGCFGQGLDQDFKTYISNKTFIQQNYSYNARNVLRGMHYQLKNAQTKLVHALYGEIYDFVLDLRIKSPSFMKIKAYKLDSPNTWLYIPAGFAHGFFTQVKEAIYPIHDMTGIVGIFEYFVDDIWNKQEERCINIYDVLHDLNITVLSSDNSISNISNDSYLQHINNISHTVASKKDLENSIKLENNKLPDKNYKELENTPIYNS